MTQKKKPMEIPQNRRFYRVPPLLPTYMGERRTTFAKAYGLKVRCYGDHVELGESIGNLKGTYWEPGKNEKKSPQ
jgi:hypothetical protein